MATSMANSRDVVRHPQSLLLIYWVNNNVLNPYKYPKALAFRISQHHLEHRFQHDSWTCQELDEYAREVQMSKERMSDEFSKILASTQAAGLEFQSTIEIDITGTGVMVIARANQAFVLDATCSRQRREKTTTDLIYGPRWKPSGTCSVDTVFVTAVHLGIAVNAGDQMSMARFNSLPPFARMLRRAMLSDLDQPEVDQWRDTLRTFATQHDPTMFPRDSWWNLERVGELGFEGSPLLSWTTIGLAEDASYIDPSQVDRQQVMYIVPSNWEGRDMNQTMEHLLTVHYTNRKLTPYFLDGLPPVLQINFPTGLKSFGGHGLNSIQATMLGMLDPWQITILRPINERSLKVSDYVYHYKPMLVWYMVNQNHYVLRVSIKGEVHEYNGMVNDGKLEKVDDFSVHANRWDILAIFYELTFVNAVVEED